MRYTSEVRHNEYNKVVVFITHDNLNDQSMVEGEVQFNAQTQLLSHSIPAQVTGASFKFTKSGEIIAFMASLAQAANLLAQTEYAKSLGGE